jgi:hypothetical protein
LKFLYRHKALADECRRVSKVQQKGCDARELKVHAATPRCPHSLVLPRQFGNRGTIRCCCPFLDARGPEDGRRKPFSSIHQISPPNRLHRCRSFGVTKPDFQPRPTGSYLLVGSKISVTPSSPSVPLSFAIFLYGPFLHATVATMNFRPFILTLST